MSDEETESSRVRRVYAFRSENEVNFLKSQAIALPDHRAMLVILMTKIGKQGVCGFERFITRVGPVKSWLDLADRIASENPAAPLTMDMIGYKDNFLVYANKKHMTRMYFKQFLHTKFKKAMLLPDFFLKRKVDLDYKARYTYPDEYEGIKVGDFRSFENDKWYTNEKETSSDRRIIKNPTVIM